MKAGGDTVRVYPRGDKSKAANGKIVLLSSNGKAIAISFGEAHVPFINGSTGMAIHLELGKMFMGKRDDEGWRDVFNDAPYYEIEETANAIP